VVTRSVLMNECSGQTARKHNAFADTVRWQRHNDAVLDWFEHRVSELIPFEVQVVLVINLAIHCRCFLASEHG